MKVLLINPQRMLKNPKIQFITPPIGLAYLASYLRQKGFEVGLIDASIGDETEGLKFGMSTKELKRHICYFRPDVVGISCMFTPRLKNVFEIARMVKDVNSKIKVVVGGMHSTNFPHDMLQEPAIDFVILGEGELPFYNLLNNLEGRSIVSRQFVEDLDELPFPARDLLQMKSYYEKGRDSLTKEHYHTSIITSRGCPYGCTFCSATTLWGKTWRKRSAKNVLDEIELLVKDYGIKELSFEDDNFSLDAERLENICKGIIQRKIRIIWNTPNGIAVQSLTKDLIRLMKQSGCNRLNLGIESGDENILHNVIKKNLSLEKIRQVTKWCKQEHITTLGYFVLGMPGETAQSIRNTIDFTKSICLDEIAVFIATPFPGTELYKTCKEKRYLKHDYTEIMAEDDIENEVFFETPYLSQEEVIKYKTMFYMEFYNAKALQNPLYYCKRVLRNPAVLSKYLKEIRNNLTPRKGEK